MSDLFASVLREAAFSEVDRLAIKVKKALLGLYDTASIETVGRMRVVTAVKGADLGIQTYGDITGTKIWLDLRGDLITIEWELIVMTGEHEGTGLARRTVEIVLDECDRFSEDAEITVQLEDWSGGFWDHIIKDYENVTWDIRPEEE
jgi:hypothetical protein